MKLRIVFVVQGEGRGHLTQALALRHILAGAGHEVVHVLTGVSPRRVIPRFFFDSIGCPVTPFESPNFKTDPSGRRVCILPTLADALLRAGAYARSVSVLRGEIVRAKPDLLVNFFDPLPALARLLGRMPRVPALSVGHQYVFGHPAYRFPPGRRVDRQVIRAYTRFTAFGSHRAALSLYPLPDRPGVTLVPPLLRAAVLDRCPPSAPEPFLLVYVANEAYGADIVRWHRRRPEVPLHCFWDRPGAGETEVLDDTLTFHRLHDSLFLDMMARCLGLVATAGFESVAEALFMGKPVFLVPIEGHFEQQCNAFDASRIGAGMAGDAFGDLDRFVEYLSRPARPADGYRDWVRSAPARFVELAQRVASRR